ncbi:MAG: type II toxin-antitoxin system PemK/MazF family toxin [Gaiellaceae bacterium]
MNRGDVWWGEHPGAGRRPYLVVTREEAISARRRVVVVPATRRIRGLPTEVRLDEEDGLPSPCALSLDNVTTMPKAMLTERICRLRGERMTEVCRALAIATSC